RRRAEMAYGPHAVGRNGGKVVFVGGAARDEDVEVVLREDHRRYAFADAVAVVRPSAERRVPPCPYLPQCGGCPWQHLTYAAQLRAKEQNLRDHLQRTAHLPDVPVLPIIASPQEFGYRSRLSLRAEDGRGGFYAGGTHTLVEVARCLLAGEGVGAAIEAASALAAGLAGRIRRVEIVARGSQPGVVLLAEIEGPAHDADGAPIARLLVPGGPV